MSERLDEASMAEIEDFLDLPALGGDKGFYRKHVTMLLTEVYALRNELDSTLTVIECSRRARERAQDEVRVLGERYNEAVVARNEARAESEELRQKIVDSRAYEADTRQCLVRARAKVEEKDARIADLERELQEVNLKHEGWILVTEIVYDQIAEVLRSVPERVLRLQRIRPTSASETEVIVVMRNGPKEK